MSLLILFNKFSPIKNVFETIHLMENPTIIALANNQQVVDMGDSNTAIQL